MRIPFVPLREHDLRPGEELNIFIGREPSVRALTAAREGSNQIVVAKQNSATSTEITSLDQISSIGCIAEVVQTARLNDGPLSVVLRGLELVQLHDLKEMQGYFVVGCTAHGKAAAAVSNKVKMNSRKPRK